MVQRRFVSKRSDYGNSHLVKITLHILKLRRKLEISCNDRFSLIAKVAEVI